MGNSILVIVPQDVISSVNEENRILLFPEPRRNKKLIYEQPSHNLSWKIFPN